MVPGIAEVLNVPVLEAVGAPQRDPQGSDQDVKRRVPMVVVSYVRTYAALTRSFVAALEATGRLDVRYDGHLSPVESFPSTVLQWVDQSDALVGEWQLSRQT